jgi:hypothetical protein
VKARLRCKRKKQKEGRMNSPIDLPRARACSQVAESFAEFLHKFMHNLSVVFPVRLDHPQQ